MLDYVIQGYVVEYYRKNAICWSSASFDTEEEAVEFIKDCRDRRNWQEYRLAQIRHAIIDF